MSKREQKAGLAELRTQLDFSDRYCVHYSDVNANFSYQQYRLFLSSATLGPTAPVPSHISDLVASLKHREKQQGIKIKQHHTAVTYAAPHGASLCRSNKGERNKPRGVRT